ncbi:MAG: threonine synthase [Alphaproteobacteria bacterium]|nr:threonine synthase [Alphaproteobacteria bacterium]
MRYVSTRGQAPALQFEDVLLAGLAADGGLYLPERWPALPPVAWRALVGKRFAAVMRAVLTPFAIGFPSERLDRLVADSFAGFAHRHVAPLRQLGPSLWLMELFHGPTLAFKDVALQLLGRLLADVLTRRGAHATVVGATSGDTGSAAIEALRGRDGIEVFILYPHGRVSDVQRRQMTTVPDANVHAIAIDGTFDDCQALVKALFADAAFRAHHQLSAVNSINWARIAAQVSYYAAAGLALGAPDRPLRFVVPTGNFGNVYAGYVASRLGLPIERLLIATNVNDILARFLERGDYRAGQVSASTSPSMDIQVASNFERLLFELLGRDGAAVRRAMQGFQQSGALAVPPPALQEARHLFAAARTDEAGTLAAIAACWRDCGILLDPHTAVGYAALRRLPTDGTPTVLLATADPAKFPDAVERATGIRPPLPPRLADLGQRPERLHRLANDLGQVQAFIARQRANRE